MKLLFHRDEFVADWVAQQPFCKPFHPPFTAIGTVDDAGVMSGGFVFTSYTGDSISLSVAGPGVVNRDGMRAVLHYVFAQLKCSRLQAHTSASNKRVRRILPRLGFYFEGTARRLYGKEDGLLFSLTVDDLYAFEKRWRLT